MLLQNKFYLFADMEKTDLLVHIQKIQLELDLEKNKKDHDSVDVEEKNKAIEKLKQELVEKDLECKKWISKIEQANDIADDVIAKNQLIESLKSEMELERNKRKHIEEMFQNLTERERNWISEKKHQVRIIFQTV